jgi:hypothetical protein
MSDVRSKVFTFFFILACVSVLYLTIQNAELQNRYADRKAQCKKNFNAARRSLNYSVDMNNRVHALTEALQAKVLLETEVSNCNGVEGFSAAVGVEPKLIRNMIERAEELIEDEEAIYANVAKRALTVEDLEE